MDDISEQLAEGKRLLELGEFQQAEAIFSECCAREPENTDAWFSLGIARHRLNRIEAAMLAFERAVYFDARNLPAQNAKAAMLVELGRPDEALEVTRQVLRMDSDNLKALANHASLLFRGGYFSEALEPLDRVLYQDPYNPDALAYRAMVLIRLHRSEEAIENTKQLSKLLPTARAFVLQAIALITMNRFEEASKAAQKAVSLDHVNIDAILVLAIAQAGLGKFDEAEQNFFLVESLDAKKLGQKLAELVVTLPSGTQSDPLFLYLALAEKRLRECNWSNRTEYLEVLQSYLENTDKITASPADLMLLRATCIAGTDPVMRRELARYIAMHASRDVQVFEHNFMARPERLRIGYLAKSFNQDALICNMAGFFALHNRLDFEIFCYSMVPGDNSQVNQRILRDSDHYVELFPATEDEAAQRIREDCIHILVDLDGIGLEYPYRMLAFQPAPIQVGYLGMPCTTGAEFLQYRITDSRVSPENTEDHWTEKLIRLPNTHQIYNQHQRISRKRINRKKYGLPTAGMVFCCFAEPELIEPEVFACWMKILHAVPDSVLWLLEQDEAMPRNLRNEAYDLGIDPKRLVFASPVEDREEHLARYRLANLFLDTFTINSCTSTSDALWAGLPVLTLFSETMGTRMTAGKLSALEFPTLICSSREEYFERACYLATHPEYLGILKRKVQRHVLTKPLFDTQRTILNLEKAYLEIWNRYFRGDQPDHIIISED